MRKYESFDPNPPNSPRNVSDVVEAKFCVDKGMPTLLKELIVLLGNEKEEWGGVKTMRACVDEFFTWKNGIPKQKDKVSTAKDLEEYLFAVDRHILVHDSDRPNIIKATTRQNLETMKIKFEVLDLDFLSMPKENYLMLRGGGASKFGRGMESRHPGRGSLSQWREEHVSPGLANAFRRRSVLLSPALTGDLLALTVEYTRRIHDH